MKNSMKTYATVRARTPAKGNKMQTALKSISVIAFVVGTLGFSAQNVRGLTVSPISLGSLPGGYQVISIAQYTIEPGEIVPWHYHTGGGWATIVSGTLTLDEGCGSDPREYSAGSSF